MKSGHPYFWGVSVADEPLQTPAKFIAPKASSNLQEPKNAAAPRFRPAVFIPEFSSIENAID
jgi:hypothetical protein